MTSHRFTKVELSQQPVKIGLNDSILSLGSCFADNIGGKLSDGKMQVLTNPLGILYNPVSLANALHRIEEKVMVKESECRNRGEIFFHYGFHSDLSSLSLQDCVEGINTKISAAHTHQKATKWLIITLGTSIVHTLKEESEVVANCHKMNKALFEKRVLSVKESLVALEGALPTDVQVIITVSPIRHTREGAVQNQRSKARLIEVANLLAEQHEHIHYFPAYEIMMDELRDYRYYEQDLIHPSVEAIEIIWSKFLDTFVSIEAQEKISEIQKLNMSLAHRPMFENSEAYKDFSANVLSKIDHLTEKYPTADFTSERKIVETRLSALKE